MQISKERRERWERLTKNDAFNAWLRPQVTAPDGSLDVDALHTIALRYGIDRREQYAHLNPGQVRMNLGNMLRKAVPPEVYGAEPRKISRWPSLHPLARRSRRVRNRRWPARRSASF